MIEADGPFHEPDYDEARDAWLRGQGFRVLRFDNSEIQNADHRVIAWIEAAGRGAPSIEL